MLLRSRRPLAVLAPLALAALVTAACGSGGGGSANAGTTATSSGSNSSPVTVKLGYFPNLTHATAIVGVQQGIFAQALGPDKLQTSTFNAGPAAVEALLSGAIDASYLGPNPAINAFVQSHGQAVRIISGATSGGAALVVKPTINSASDLRGKKLATPQLGNTQDVALRYWLLGKGLHTDPQGGGDLSILPQDNATALQAFRSGQIDGAWEPEPWVSQMVAAGGKVLVNEKSLWPGGRFVTTELAVRTEFLHQHPDAVARLVQGQVQANDFVNQHPAQAQQAVNQGLAQLTGKPLPAGIVQSAWPDLTFTDDPVASSLAASAAHAQKVGLLPSVDLKGIYDLTPLNAALAQVHEPQVKAA
ncbi:MAG TPA: ABC transporter substrate-binding protein [Acidimicrobiales bacterium]|nr:ABC transporter substrate-binding protein [Acidimicrobiales bacterium]